MVILGVREEAKNRTREIILRETSLLLQRSGFVKVSTKDISRECNVSQGTIFLHFKTKETLLNVILSSNIEGLEIELKHSCSTNDIQDIFLRNFLNTMISFENMLSRAYKDYPYLSDVLRKQLDSLDVFFKNLFYDNLKNNSTAPLSIVDSFLLIDSFMSQIKNYLLEKDPISSSNSIIRQRRGRIIKLYRLLFG